MKWIRRTNGRYQARVFLQAEERTRILADWGVQFRFGQHVGLGYFWTREAAKKAAFDFAKNGGRRPGDVLPHWVRRRPPANDYFYQIRIPGLKVNQRGFGTPREAFEGAAQVVIDRLGLEAIKYLPTCLPERDWWQPMLRAWLDKGKRTCKA